MCVEDKVAAGSELSRATSIEIAVVSSYPLEGKNETNTDKFKVSVIRVLLALNWKPWYIESFTYCGVGEGARAYGYTGIKPQMTIKYTMTTKREKRRQQPKGSNNHQPPTSQQQPDKQCA